MNKVSRSDKYQYILKEISTDNKFLINYTNNQSLNATINNYKYNEKILDLQDQLMKRVWEIINLICTAHQKEIIILYYKDNYTHKEIGIKKKISTTSVVKSIVGNCNYNKNKRFFGGALPKVKKKLLKDEIYLNLSKQIQEYKEDIL